jgi:hypothetical protein
MSDSFGLMESSKDPLLSNHETARVQVRIAAADAYAPQSNRPQDSMPNLASKSDAAPTAPTVLPEPVFDTLYHILMPGAVGISARAVHLGLTGQLHIDAGAYRRQFASMESPVAQTLAKRLTELEENGWQILKAAPDAHAGLYSPGQRRIFAQPQGSMLRYMAGLDASPIKHTLPIVAHELGHSNGVPIYRSVLSDVVEQAVMHERSVEGETISMLAETHIAGQLNVKDHRPYEVNTGVRTAAIKAGTLGEYIGETHFPKQDIEKAGQITNRLIDTVYSGSPIDAATGKVRAFDLESLYGRVTTALPADNAARMQRQKQDYLRIRADNGPDLRSARDQFLHAGESDTRSMAAHFGKGVLALGALAMVSDIAGAFEESTAAGLGRTAKTGIEWGGYSMGASLANRYVDELAVTRPTLATLPVMVLGFIGAYAADKLLGEQAEEKIRGL